MKSKLLILVAVIGGFLLQGCNATTFLGASDSLPGSMRPDQAEMINVEAALNQPSGKEIKVEALSQSPTFVPPKMKVKPRSSEMLVKFFINGKHVSDDLMQGPYHIMARLRKSGWGYDIQSEENPLLNLKLPKVK